jgi:hypothetical protein
MYYQSILRDFQRYLASNLQRDLRLCRFRARRHGLPPCCQACPNPGGTPQEIDVATILTWPQDLIPLPIDQPRTGRELQLVHVALAFLQNASINPGDCDIHMEISAVADKQAPRVVVETPVDSEYCRARQSLQSQLKKHGFQLDVQHGGELPQSLRISVLGLPFEDFEHGRGSAQVSTLWEIHPAQVTIM